MMHRYFSEQQVRNWVEGSASGMVEPWRWENSNAGELAAHIEFWEAALVLDDGELVEKMGLEARARDELEKWTWFRDHNEFRAPPSDASVAEQRLAALEAEVATLRAQGKGE